MKEKHLLYAIGWVEDGYILEMQQYHSPRISRKGIWLIAAVIGALLILSGCVAVFLRLQDMSIGKETYTENYNNQGLAIEPTESTRDILTWGGHNGEPMQLALKEWYEFLETYDADGSLQAQFLGTENMDFPERYYHTYNCYTKEMVG